MLGATVFAEIGAEAQMDDVARQAGVGVGTVCRHFPTKQALAGGLARQQFALFVAEARGALAIEADPFEVIADLTVADIPMVMCGVSTSMSRAFNWRRHLELGSTASGPGTTRPPIVYSLR